MEDRTHGFNVVSPSADTDFKRIQIQLEWSDGYQRFTQCFVLSEEDNLKGKVMSFLWLGLLNLMELQEKPAFPKKKKFTSKTIKFNITLVLTIVVFSLVWRMRFSQLLVEFHFWMFCWKQGLFLWLLQISFFFSYECKTLNRLFWHQSTPGRWL